jgi:glycosyltransferase involved in cell wall biosynthesis
MPDRLQKLRVAARVLRSEGLLALADRVADAAAERVRRLSYRDERIDLRGTASEGPDPLPSADPPILYVLGGPPQPSRGGLQGVVRRWLQEASRRRPVALLFPERRGRYRLEVTGPGVRRSFTLTAGGDGGETALADAGFERALAWTRARTGARILHLLGLYGIPLESLERVLPPDAALVASVHDFSAFCFRPHLLERPVLQFCDYCRDLDRCHRCLSHDLSVGREEQARRRAVAGRLLARSRAVVFPSRFSSAAHAALFPLPAEVRRVVEPSDPGAPSPSRSGGGRRRGGGIAYVGSALPHKGILVFEEVVARLAAPGRRFTVLGGGVPEVLRRLRRTSGVRVRGYYRQGSLPRLLERTGVEVALLLSIVPETYGLTLNECRAAGVPVIAFDHGALGERIREEGGGLLVPLASGADGVVDAVRRLDEARERAVVAAPPRRAPADEEEDWRRLYEEVLAGSAPAPAPE